MLNQALKRIGRVQKVDSAILELQRRFSLIDPGRGPQAKYAEATAKVEEAEANLKTVRSELEDLDLKNKGIEAKMKSEKDRLYSGGIYNAKDAEAIERELENLKQRRNATDERILELWEAIEPAQKEVVAAKKAQEETKARLDEYEAKYAEVRAEYESKLAQLTAAREKEAEGCDPELMKKYEVMRKKRGGIGLSAVVEAVCTACHTAVPKKQLGDLRIGKTLETCQNCLRYMYLEEEA